MTTTDIAGDERARLAELEAVVERGLATFVEVGQALMEIRESHLYRETHGTFEDYCQERWEMTRPRAYQLIAAAEVIGAMSTTVDTAPTNEAQARELAPLLDEPEKLTAAWSDAVERTGGKPTAKDVRSARLSLVENERNSGRNPKPRTAASDIRRSKAAEPKTVPDINVYAEKLVKPPTDLNSLRAMFADGAELTDDDLEEWSDELERRVVSVMDAEKLADIFNLRRDGLPGFAVDLLDSESSIETIHIACDQLHPLFVDDAFRVIDRMSNCLQDLASKLEKLCK